MKSPTPWPGAWTGSGPVPSRVEDLQRAQPFETREDALLGIRTARFEQRVGGERRVPDWRKAGLAIGLVFFDH